MTQEEKELLLKDLCTRLPYEVIVNIKYSKECGSSYRLRVCSEGDLKLNTDLFGLFIQEEIYLKPYLRPLFSMTKEERKELELLVAIEVDNAENEDEDISEWCLYDRTGILNARGGARFYFDEMIHMYDWLYQHHFDFRGLIEKGLALEAPEGMYK